MNSIWTKRKLSLKKNRGLISIGVDVGSVNGAIGVIDEDGNILALTKVPTYQTEVRSRRNKSKLNKETLKYEQDYRKRTWVDYKRLRDILEPFLDQNIIYTIEKVHSRSGEKEVSSFMNGNALGIFQGLYPLLQPMAFFDPSPEEWKKGMGVSSLKDTSVNLAEEIFQIKLKSYLPKGKVDDIAEALLLAFYGLKSYYTKGD